MLATVPLPPICPRGCRRPPAAQRRFARTILRACVAVALSQAVAPMAVARSPKELSPSQAQWRVDGELGKSKKARENLSGLACSSPAFKVCIAVNDDKKYAQLFRIDGTTIEPGTVVRLLDSTTEGDPDAEGAAYDAQTSRFYIVGSHGRPRNHPDRANDASYNVFRFSIDPASGKPNLDKSEGELIVTEATTALRNVIKNARSLDEQGGDSGAVVSSQYDQPLGTGGVNVEGIAVADKQLYLGLRGPSNNNRAFVLSVDADAAFTANAKLGAKISTLELGKDTGIRDLAAVKGGLLVLSGPVNDQEDVKPAIFFWNPANGDLKKLAILKRPTSVDNDDKAEGLLVLEDTADRDLRVLVMFDGPDNGAPTEYAVPR